MSGPSLARRERAALCDLALALGPDAPTLCEGWTARDLVLHLLVRERHPLVALGQAVPALARVGEPARERLAGSDLPALVGRLRSPRGTPFAVPVLDRLANSVEFFVHHEDLRRARSGWSPRPLAPADADIAWSSLTRMGRLLVRRAPVGVRVVRADTGRSAVLRRGTGGPDGDGVTVTGPVSELLLFAFGRREVRDLAFDGAESAVEALRGADLGL